MNYRYCYLLASLLLLIPALSRAQQVRPLGSEPAHALVGDAGAAQRAVVLPLPFFDDFARQPEGRPDAQRWEPTGGALVNNRYPRRPISRNVATLDGLDGLGRPRGAIGRVGDADSLTSQPIDLSGLQPTDKVYLSFFWQAGTRRGRPESSGTRPIALYVEFKREGQGGTWDEVWRLNSPGDTTNFRFKALPIDQAAYLHGAFQFRIRTSGYLYNARDAWSVDYVRLDRNRSATDSTFRDIATSRALPSALRRYTAMPVNQFNANVTSELATTRTPTTANNLDGGPAPTPITWLGLLDVLPDNITSRFLRGNASLDAQARQYPIAGEASVPAVPLTPAPKQLRQRVVLITNETDPRTLANDTISRRTDLSDYFAYDDGTAEASLSLAPASTGPPSYYALRFDLNQPDQVRGLRLYPVLATAAGRTLTAAIWDVAEGSSQPTAQPKATKTFTVPLTLPAGQPYVDVVFDTPVKVSSNFFAGYGQAPTTQFVEFGYDLNNASPADYLYFGSQGVWQKFNPATNYSPAGALMLRPLMGGGVITATPTADVAARYRLAPNPAPNGRVRVPGPYRHATVLDALGRVVWEQPVAEAGQPELQLPLAAGLYFVRLLLPDGQIITQRLAVGGQ
ncbi:hypothetical protein [Hymenobacter psychrophilus]|uniref:Por secretion system C-terminal sorting domain-containing protein n=1 Tax=Hymenobacter psychrophilus TaxID=651662 RepID=A0A1H3DQ14_9BACT|nr:hypothetical protein [Hymenobacter psychrophilus]SDX68603.1 Por secretion system C-terminal sorting domain-containing protein [Hymenobacter psychrophilus]